MDVIITIAFSVFILWVGIKIFKELLKGGAFLVKEGFLLAGQSIEAVLEHKEGIAKVFLFFWVIVKQIFLTALKLVVLIVRLIVEQIKISNRRKREKMAYVLENLNALMDEIALPQLGARKATHATILNEYGRRLNSGEIFFKIPKELKEVEAEVWSLLAEQEDFVYKQKYEEEERRRREQAEKEQRRRRQKQNHFKREKPESPPDSPFQKACQTLGVSEKSSVKEIKASYRLNQHAWHPDKFPQNSKMQKQAEEKVIALNEAYALIKKQLGFK